LDRRKKAKKEKCDLIFHNAGHAIKDYRKCWQTACTVNGLGAFYCRDCRDSEGKYTGKLDATRHCERCGKKWAKDAAKYIGKIFHDFRRSACYEMRKAGSLPEDCAKVSGHLSLSMFKRYSDLFEEEEERECQRQVLQRRAA